MQITMTGRSIGYRRVSTAEQVGSALGLDAQQHAIDATAARLGLTVAATFTDAGVSGGLPLEQRPALLAALDALNRGDVLIVAKRDRLGRDVLNVAMLERLTERKGARIVSAAGEGTDDDGPTSVLMRQIIDSFAQYERAIIRARTRAALAVKKARGQRVGGVPFGFQVDTDGRSLIPHAGEQRALALIAEQRQAGATFQATADTLNARGFRSRTGRPWSWQSVQARTADAEDKAPSGALCAPEAKVCCSIVARLDVWGKIWRPQGEPTFFPTLPVSGRVQIEARR
jgi:DNA invertase Pin-like site-specific DNA recombinase